MKFDEKKLKEILLGENYISEADMKKAEDFAQDHRSSILDYLMGEELLTSELLGQALAESYKIPYANLEAHEPGLEQVMKVPEAVAKKFRVVLFNESAKKAVFATDDPSQEGIPAELAPIFPGKKISFVYALPEE